MKAIPCFSDTLKYYISYGKRDTDMYLTSHDSSKYVTTPTTTAVIKNTERNIFQKTTEKNTSKYKDRKIKKK